MGKTIARLKRVLLVIVITFVMMPVSGTVQTADAASEEDIDVLSVKYNAKMAFDCQRSPAVPEKREEERIYGLKDPYKCANQNGSLLTLGDTYLKVEPCGLYKDQTEGVKNALVNGGKYGEKMWSGLLKEIPADERGDVPIYKLVQYDHDGSLIGDCSDPGCLYILDLKSNSFIFCGCGFNTNNSYGYFLHGAEIENPSQWNNMNPKIFTGDQVEGLVTKKKDVHPEASVVTAPVPKTGLIENGKPQELITAGSAEGGTMHYAISNDPSAVPGDGWSASIPAGIKAGTYYVWYKVVGDTTHADSDPAGPLTVKITPKQYTVTYELNGGKLDGQTGTVSAKYDKGTVITLPEPARKGYTFDHWEGSTYNAGDNYTVTEDHTFKAVWKTADAGKADKKDGSSKKGVSTGDENDLAFWIVLMTASLAGAVGITLRNIKRRG